LPVVNEFYGWNEVLPCSFAAAVNAAIKISRMYRV